MKAERIKLSEKGYLDTYIIDEKKELNVSSRPGVLVFPGGGYLYCSDREAECVALKYLSYGFNAFVCNYTCASKFDDSYNDAAKALSHIQKHMKDYNLNSIIVLGFSAGGHLAACLGTMYDNKPDGMILIYPALKWHESFSSAPNIFDYVDSKTSKTFLVHTYDDSLCNVSGSIEFILALSKANVEFESHIYRHGEHGFSVATKEVGSGKPSYLNDIKANWVEMSVKWIEGITKDIVFKEEEPLALVKLNKRFYTPIGKLESDINLFEAVLKRYPKIFEEFKDSDFKNLPIGLILLRVKNASNQVIEDITSEIENK